MANEEHLAILKKGVAARNEWRKQHPDIMPDLSGADLHDANLNTADPLHPADLRGANLGGAHLDRAYLRGAHLDRAYLRGADLRGAHLYGANLHKADLSEADLSWAGSFYDADLSEANLSGSDLTAANLSGANFNGANLRETDFGEATLGLTAFAAVDLSTAKGLETVHHEGPSSIGVDTIYRSQGKIPEVFLRGVGLPDDFIGYIKSIAGAIQFYSCFISYSGKDQEFADRLYEGLQNKGVRCWFAPHDVKAGEKLHEQIDAAIRLHDKLLLILSEHSMNSEWVKTEIFNAREREVADKKRKLFPVRLVPFETLYDWKCFDAKTGKDLAREIAEYFIPDFANWKDHDSYQNGFERLLKDLKSPDAEAKSAATAKE
jgi:TIR domain/Pentapeptide repeats (8 copies)